MRTSGGLCLCGAVTFDVDGVAFDQLPTCHCSIRRRTGASRSFVPGEKLRRLSGFRFGEKNIHCRSCSFCEQ